MDTGAKVDACKSPRRLPRKKSTSYSSCMLYDVKQATVKLDGIAIATCNPSAEEEDRQKDHTETELSHHPRYKKHHVVSEKMSCNYCATEFMTRFEQIGHYKSDWHRYNLKIRLRGGKSVTEEEFEQIADGDVSSISGSEDESELSDTDVEASGGKRSKPMSIPQHVQAAANSGTESESEGGMPFEVTARKYPKIYFRNGDGELVSVFRCLLYHKKKPPKNQSELVVMTTDLPRNTRWAICMTAGGHFAAAVFDGETVIAHKTFHRYVVRAKRGSAQSSRDSQGGAPKSAGASLRRYNEAALAQEVQELLSSWSEHLKKCHLIFLRAPSFNRQIFYGNKNPPFKKDDHRIRTIPFPTRRPTQNEVKRVHQMLASIECYGPAADVQDFVPISPLRHYSAETGKLEIVSEDALRRSPRKLKDKELSTSPLACSPKHNSGSPRQMSKFQTPIPDHLLVEDNMASSSATSDASDVDLVEMTETLSTLDLVQFDNTPVPQRPKRKHKRKPSKHQIEPDSDVYGEERYHLRNALYTACKVGDKDSLRDLLAILNHTSIESPANEADASNSSKTENGENVQAENTSLKESSEETAGTDNVFECTESVKEINSETSEVQKLEASETPQICVAQCDNSEEVVQEKLLRTDGTDSKQDGALSFGNNISNSESNSNMNATTAAKPVGFPEFLTPGNFKHQLELSPLVSVDVLNEPFGDNETTLLHVASKSGHSSCVRLLLKAGSDPTVKDRFSKVAFNVASDKETRNQFRRFMGDFPDKYDYVKAQIPGPLTSEMEAEKRAKDAERKKKQKKARQERQKERKEENAKVRAEEEEKKRYLALSDREKRALAAERRLVNQHESTGAPSAVLSRCWQCGSDMTGKVPFEYSNYKFCASKCLQKHRKTTKS